MKAAITLDRDVAARLEHVARKRGLPFKVIVNDALRAGLAVIDKPAASSVFHTVGFDLGPSLVGGLDDVQGVLARVEGEKHK